MLDKENNQLLLPLNLLQSFTAAHGIARIDSTTRLIDKTPTLEIILRRLFRQGTAPYTTIPGLIDDGQCTNPRAAVSFFGIGCDVFLLPF